MVVAYFIGGNDSAPHQSFRTFKESPKSLDGGHERSLFNERTAGTVHSNTTAMLAGTILIRIVERNQVGGARCWSVPCAQLGLNWATFAREADCPAAPLSVLSMHQRRLPARPPAFFDNWSPALIVVVVVAPTCRFLPCRDTC